MRGHETMVMFAALRRSNTCNATSHLPAQAILRTQIQERFDRLRVLSPIDAVRAWLNGHFGIGDEPAMITAIRKEPRVSLSDDDVFKAVCDAPGEGLNALDCLERLAAS